MEVGFCREWIGQPRVVGTSVGRDHGPAPLHKHIDGRRADSTAGACHDSDAVHGYCAPASRNAMSRATRAARTCRPRSYGATLGHPSMPFALNVRAARLPVTLPPLSELSSLGAEPSLEAGRDDDIGCRQLMH